MRYLVTVNTIFLYINRENLTQDVHVVRVMEKLQSHDIPATKDEVNQNEKNPARSIVIGLS